MTPEEFISDRNLERCDFDDECDVCDGPPEGGTWVQMSYGPDVAEANYYICGACIKSAAENAEKWQEPA